MNSLVGSIFAAFSAQGVSMLCSVVMTLVVPKLIGVEEFGYWQLFIFYSSYVSFFQLGLNDGVYLEHGGESRSVIDKKLLTSEFVVGSSMQILIAVFIACYAVFCGENESRQFVLFSTAAYLVVSNAYFYWGYVLQCMNETRKYSFSTVVDRALFLAALLICVLFRVENFRIYVILFVLARIAALTYCSICVREFISCGIYDSNISLRATIGSMKTGIVLTVANISSMLILGIARYAVDMIWGIEDFGEISLSLSLVNFALAFISQTSMVLFPALRTSDSSSLKAMYIKLKDVLSIMLPLSLLLYYPARILLVFWLPQYEGSLQYLSLLMPICILEAQTNLISATYYKVKNDSAGLLKCNVIALVFGIISILFGLRVFFDPHYVVLFATFGIAVRNIIGDWHFSHQYGVWSWRQCISQVALCASFCAISQMGSLAQMFALTCILLIAFYLVNWSTLFRVLSTSMQRFTR